MFKGVVLMFVIASSTYPLKVGMGDECTRQHSDEIPQDAEIRESKLYREDGFFINVT